jgi:hypothetical protein
MKTAGKTGGRPTSLPVVLKNSVRRYATSFSSQYS